KRFVLPLPLLFLFEVQVLDVSQLPRVGELGYDLYTGVSLARATSLRELEPSQEITWPSRITFVGESTQLCLHEDADGEPLVQRDDGPLYHALRRHSPSDESMPTLGMRMLVKPGVQWAAGTLHFEGDTCTWMDTTLGCCTCWIVGTLKECDLVAAC
ncbi:hypothetical protein AMTR_s00006p00107020, partial [Amborella trichopoda]